MIDYRNIRQSHPRLEERQEKERYPDADLPARIRDGISGSVFRRSKTCYDCLWIARKKIPGEESGIAGPPDRPKPICHSGPRAGTCQDIVPRMGHPMSPEHNAARPVTAIFRQVPSRPISISHCRNPAAMVQASYRPVFPVATFDDPKGGHGNPGREPGTGFDEPGLGFFLKAGQGHQPPDRRGRKAA